MALLAFSMCSSGSQVFSSSGNPFHFTRKNFLSFTFFTSFTFSTSCSSCPSIISGGGLGLSSFCCGNCGSWAGFNFDSWNVSCMSQLGGSSNLYADFPTADITLKGPWNRASSFLDARVVFIFEASRYTRSPGWYCLEGLTCLSCCCFILSAAFSRFCFVVFHVSLNRSMYSAAEWFAVACPSIPLNGFRPVVIINGENPVAECCRSL